MSKIDNFPISSENVGIMWFWPQIRKLQLKIPYMGDFHMNRAFNKGDRPKISNKVSNFEDHAENFYSDKKVHFYNMRYRATYSIIVYLQCKRALFLISDVFWKKYELLFCYITSGDPTMKNYKNYIYPDSIKSYSNR